MTHPPQPLCASPPLQAVQGRRLELLLWLMEAGQPRAARHLAATLSQADQDQEEGGPLPEDDSPWQLHPHSLLARLLRGPVASPATPLHVRLKAAQLLGMCCEASDTALMRCWAPLERVLMRESCGELR